MSDSVVRPLPGPEAGKHVVGLGAGEVARLLPGPEAGSICRTLGRRGDLTFACLRLTSMLSDSGPADFCLALRLTTFVGLWAGEVI